MLMNRVVAGSDANTYGRSAHASSPERLARQYMPLVRKIAWHVHGRVSSAIEIEDLLQIGMVALVEARANSVAHPHPGKVAPSVGARRARCPRRRGEIGANRGRRSEEHTSELQSLMRISYAVFCLKKKKNDKQ